MPRIGGRILALLLVADEPFTLDELAAKLKVSKASASTNLRHFMQIGLVDIVTPLGERKAFYQWSANAWERRTDVAQTVARGIKAIAENGLTAISPANTAARDRLEQSIEYADYFIGALDTVRAGWLARLAEKGTK